MNTPYYSGKYSRLKSLRDSRFTPAWRAMANLLFSNDSQILNSTGNKKWRPNNKMFDRTGAESLKTSASGLSSSVMSPARNWFALETENRVLNGRKPVKVWLESTTRDLLSVMAKSNVYGAMGRVFRDTLWANGVAYFEDDDEDVIRLYPLEVGTYVLGQDRRGEVTTCAREFTMEATDIKAMFDSYPESVDTAIRSGMGDQQFTIYHYVCPNEGYTEGGYGVKGKKFHSIYYMCEGQSEHILREGGYDEFPFIVARWDPGQEEPYSQTTPAMDAYNDMRSLQILAKGGLKAAQKAVDPPLAIPAGVSDINREPGAEVAVNGATKVSNLEEITYDWNGISLIYNGLEQRVRRAFFADVFQHFLQSDRREQTAEEVRAKIDEQYAMLAPIVSALYDGPIRKLIDLTFQAMVRAGRIQPAPPELVGSALKITYASVYEQSQQAGNLNQLRAHLLDVLSIASSYPGAMDTTDIDEGIQLLATYRQIPATVTRDDKEIDDIRTARAQIQAKQMQLQQAEQQAKTMQALGKARVSSDTALGQEMQQ